MTLVFMDGCSHYATANIGEKWTTQASGPTIVAGGRWPGTSFLRSPNNSGSATYSFIGTPSKVVVGFAFRFTASSGTSVTVMQVLESGSEQLSYRLVSNTGVLTLTRAGTVLATASPLAAGVWHYIELEADIDNVAGTYKMRLNGGPMPGVPDATGVDTQNTANASWNGFRFGNTSTNSGNLDMTDLYLLDGSGSTNNSLLGDCRIETLFPTAAGNYTQLTPSAGANFAAVDEAAPNTTDYVTSTVDDQIDSYTMADLSAITGNVFGAQGVAYAMKTTTGAKRIALFRRASDGNDWTSLEQYLSGAFRYYLEQFDVDRRAGPSTAGWTIGTINGLEFGAKAKAP